MNFFKKTWVQLTLGAFVLLYLYRRFGGVKSSDVVPLPFAGRGLISPTALRGGAFGSLERIDAPNTPVENLVAPKTGAFS